jgi:hypothetical protein
MTHHQTCKNQLLNIKKMPRLVVSFHLLKTAYLPHSRDVVKYLFPRRIPPRNDDSNKFPPSLLPRQQLARGATRRLL